MSNPLNYFVGRCLDKFDYAATTNGDDIALIFKNIPDRKLVFSHLFTIPFKVIEGRLKRLPDWLKPLEFWKENFLNKLLLKIDTETYEKDFCLEFEGDLVLLTNKNLISILDDNNNCLWTTMVTT